MIKSELLIYTSLWFQQMPILLLTWRHWFVFLLFCSRILIQNLILFRIYILNLNTWINHGWMCVCHFLVNLCQLLVLLLLRIVWSTFLTIFSLICIQNWIEILLMRHNICHRFYIFAYDLIIVQILNWQLNIISPFFLKISASKTVIFLRNRFAFDFGCLNQCFIPIYFKWTQMLQIFEFFILLCFSQNFRFSTCRTKWSSSRCGIKFNVHISWMPTFCILFHYCPDNFLLLLLVFLVLNKVLNHRSGHVFILDHLAPILFIFINLVVTWFTYIVA